MLVVGLVTIGEFYLVFHGGVVEIIGRTLPCTVVQGPGCGPASGGHCGLDRNLQLPMCWLLVVSPSSWRATVSFYRVVGRACTLHAMHSQDVMPMQELCT